MDADTVTWNPSKVSWWTLLLAGEAILVALGTGIVRDANGASLANSTVAQGVMLAAVIVFFAASATFLVSWLGADERGISTVEAARGWWKVPLVLAAEALLVVFAAGVTWDYSTSAPLVDPSVLQPVMLVGALLFVAAFAVCLTGVLQAGERV